METRIAAAESAADIEAARRLIADYARSLPFSLDFQNFPAELAALPRPYTPPAGCLLLARRGDEAIGVVALKPLAPGVAEIKRLYLVPAARRLGLGRALIERAVEEARRRFYERVRLDSHRATMMAAMALYRRLGFVEIPPYGPDFDGAFAFFEKTLTPRREP